MKLVRDMKPTTFTLFKRQCKIYQLLRFIILDLKILKAVMFPPHHDKTQTNQETNTQNKSV